MHPSKEAFDTTLTQTRQSEVVEDQHVHEVASLPYDTTHNIVYCMCPDWFRASSSDSDDLQIALQLATHYRKGRVWGQRMRKLHLLLIMYMMSIAVALQTCHLLLQHGVFTYWHAY